MLSVAFNTDRTKPFIDTQNQMDTQTLLTDREASYRCSDRTDGHRDRQRHRRREHREAFRKAQIHTHARVSGRTTQGTKQRIPT